MFWGQDWSLSPKVGFIHYLRFITATTFKTPDYGQVSEATNLECDVPSSESYTEVLWLVAWMVVLKVSLIFLPTFVFPTGLCQLDQSLCH
jgi:hypothetical protein